MNKRQSILILGGDADGNLGDRAILTAMCAAIKRIEPQAEIIATSEHPDNLRAILDATVLKRGLRGLPRLCAAARRSRIVLIGGGGLFQDDDSLVKMPYWAARCLLMRLCCKRLAGCSIGAGPLRSFSSRLSAMIAFSVMQRVSVRDHIARRTVQPLTSTTVEVVPDPAFMLDPLDDTAGRRLLSEQGVPLNDGPLIGVTIRRWFPPKPRWIPNRILPRKDNPMSHRLLELYAQTLDRVLSRCGGRVVMMPTYNLAHEGDDRLCGQVIKLMAGERAHLVRVNDPALYQAVARQLSLMVAGRMHSAILAASVGTPVVGLAYNPKFHGVFELLGKSDVVMDVESFVNSADVDGFARLIESTLHRRRPAQPAAAQLAQQTRQWLTEVLS
ncbi:MAG: polysaccharide pyruvyl transferase family protein [Phycisphaeraceae bacterium]|nr:polysaccharide pyruvyl transferase family protein [Phycisphaeraceae bacterium]